MKKFLAIAGALALMAVPARADVQFFFNIPGFGQFGVSGGGYDDYPPPPAYPPQYAPVAPIYGGNYYYKGDFPQPPPYAYPRYPGGVVVGGGGGYYEGYQGGYGYKKHRRKKHKRHVEAEVPPRDVPGYHPKPGCNKPPMCTGGRPWRPQQ